jgi:F-type H+-transporting ATPase subunit epsilon
LRLKVLLPNEVYVDEAVSSVTAEAENGSFCLLPRHIDFVAALVPGLLLFVSAATSREEFLAVDEGVLVKCGPDVMVSTRHAVLGQDLGTLKQTVDERFRVLDERERLARSAVVRLEADLVRRFVEMEKQYRG